MNSTKAASQRTSLEIFHVCPRPAFSGLEQYALSLAEAQKQAGHEVSFLVLPDSPLEKRCRDGSIKVVYKSGPEKNLRKWFLNWFQKQRMNRQAGLLGQHYIIHIHSTQDVGTMAPLIFLARTFLGAKVKVILQTHIWIDHSKRDPLHALTYALLDEVWCSSEPARQCLEKYLPVSSPRIKIMRYGRNIAGILAGFLDRDEARHSLGIKPSGIVLGTVARIDRGKGTYELFSGAQDWLLKNPDAQLVFIGGATTSDPQAQVFAEELAQKAKELPLDLQKRIYFLGDIKDSYKYLKAFDLFALPSYKECFALSLLEAQLAGLPVLSSNSGGTPEVVIENQTGWLFEPRSDHALAEALERAMAQREKWYEFGIRAQARVREEFDFAKIIEQIHAQYCK